MNLLVAELWRFWSRRVTKVTVLVIIVISTIGMAIAAANSTDDERVHFEELGDVLGGIGPLLVFVTILLAASSLGGEFGAASLSTQLLFEPRRIRVWVTKAAAIAIGAGVVTFIATIVVSGEFYAVAAARGDVNNIDGTWWTGRSLDIGRLVAAGSIGALLGFSITGIARRTAAALAGFVVLFIAEPLLYNVTDTFDGKFPIWSLFTFVNNPFDDPFYNPTDTFGFASLAEAVAPPLAWAAVMLIVTGWQFSRSEIR